MIIPGFEKAPVIHDGNYADFCSPVIDGVLKFHGCLPRDFMRCPVGYLATARPFDLAIPAESKWEGLLQNRIAAKAQLTDLRMIMGPDGKMIPSRDHTGTLHFHSSTTSGSASRIRARRRPSIVPRQSPSSLILSSIS